MYDRACKGGAPDVCNTLGEIVSRTGTLEGGLERANGLFEKACEGGSSAGCLNFGLAFAEREDYRRAAELYEKSCTGGWAAGCHQLAGTFERGEGVSRDLSRALALYAQACDWEFVESCETAGTLYLAGALVPRDVPSAKLMFDKAIRLLDEACQAGVEAECLERDRFRTRVAIALASERLDDGRR
jgi:TPR repeat protein